MRGATDPGFREFELALRHRWATVADVSPSARSCAPLLVLLLLGPLACGDDSASGGGGSAAQGGSGAGGQPVVGGGGAGGSGGAAVDPVEAAVRAHDWQEVAGAPKVGQGKQDDIFFATPQKGFLASGPKGAVFATDDGGATWTEALNSPTTYFRSVLFTSETHGFAGNIGAGLSPSISDATLMYATDDGGASWAPVTDITGSAAKGLCNFTAVDADHLFGIGRANGPAHLLASSDAGASWIAKDLSAELLMAIDGRFTSPTEGIVVGMGSNARCKVIHTSDGGDSWNTVFVSDNPATLCWKLDFPSASVGYLAILDTGNGSGTFAKTQDGGATWLELPLPTDQPYSGIGVGFLTEEIGWMAPEDPGLPVYRTFDGGLTWEEDPALVAPINRFRFIDDNTAFAVGGAVWKLDLSAP